MGIGRAQSSRAFEEPDQLRADAIGLPGALMLGVVIMAPSFVIYFNWGFMIPYVGRATAIIFVIALVMSLPTCYSYTLLNRGIPTAGATYRWASRLITPQVGIAAGVCTTLYYAFILAAELAFLPVVGRDLVGTTSTTVFALIMWGSLLAIIPLVYRGINVSLGTSIVLVAVELAIVVAVAVGAFLASTDRHVSLAPLDPALLRSTRTVIPALVLGVVSYTGYDAISTLGGETRSAAVHLPRATLLALLLVGAFWTVTATILSDALPPAAYAGVIRHGSFPLAAAAQTAFGSGGRTLIDVMALQAGFALLLGSSIGATRITYTMGRDGVISRRFGRVHPAFRVPWFALSAALVFAVVVDIALSVYLGLGPGIALWLVNLIGFFALITYLVINICNPLLFLRHSRNEFHWFSNGLVPLCGVAVVGYFLYKSFFETLWRSDFKTGKSVVVTALGLLALSAIVGWRLGRERASRTAAEV
jgi:amino acid transporter